MAEAPMERGGQGNLALAQSTPTERVEWQAAIYWLYQEDEVSPTARYEKGQLHYTVTDQVGTITELMSETGYIDYRQKLSLWGEATIDGHRHPAANDSQALGCHHRFAGQYYDEESELHYNRFRYYSPETGQYLSHDPIGLLGGFNPYGYVFDPTGWIDPLGLAACHDSGELGRQKSMSDLDKNDFEIVGEEVTMRVNGSRIRADFVARDSDGRLHVFESKHGNSRLTPNQSSSGVYDIGNPSNNNGVIDTSKGTVSNFEIATGNPDKISGISPDAKKGKIYEAVFHVLKYE